MDTRQRIQRYSQELATYLAPLDPADAAEVIREIEGHVLDVLEQSERSGQLVQLENVLAGFGEPRELAARYVSHVLAGTPPPRGFRAIQTVRRGVTRGLYGSMAAFGYGLALCFLSLAVVKLLGQGSVGLWATPGGESVVIGFTGAPHPDQAELLGPLFAPVALALAAAIGLLTRRVLQVLSRSLR
ncbi:HAAS signaling domain-containing protein [Roseateles asaccharophilus]|uniref:DUF1700 domain-containing protein n=1 Tax=Roseateles asaccharophilus TaxID=582607 RepID=A0ABU2AEP9_9BURK|nr:hypothetical protein [Roseateles asaccharophilus]MDR7335686.1 hypothetical protein [Roseateles asaccharophilus]